MNEQESAEWHRRVRLGALKAIGYQRGLQVRRIEPTEDDRKGLIDLMDYFEDFIRAGWHMEDEMHEHMTKRASDKVRERT